MPDACFGIALDGDLRVETQNWQQQIEEEEEEEESSASQQLT